MVQLISNFMLASTEPQVNTCFLVHYVETCMFNDLTRMFNHLTRVFKFVFDCHGFTIMHLSSNSSGMHCKYVTSSDSSLRVHTSKMKLKALS